MESGKTDFIWKKSYEISYALWRIAANIKQKDFADKIAGKSTDLISFAAERDYIGVGAILGGLKYLIHFGSDVGVINPDNKDILFKEIGNLEIEIAGLPIAGLPESKSLDIADIFSSSENSGAREEHQGSPQGSEIRQTAILERIRQSGNCRLGELQVILPEVSERTIRYDMDVLVQKKLVERMGIGGRGVYYRIPQ
jgi:hypothetical protein